MDIKQLDETTDVARRFVVTALEAKRAIKVIEEEHNKWYPVVSKDVASCKRASLDLTRSLAKLRQ